MLLLLIQVAATVVASARGWGATPLWIMGAVFVLGVTLPFILGVIELHLLVANIIDVAAAGALIGMAIAGRKPDQPLHKPPPTPDSTH